MHLTRKRVAMISLLTIISFLLVLGLQIASNRRLNYLGQNYIRRYQSTPELIRHLDLRSPHYYIAGLSDSAIYLGNYIQKNKLTSFNFALKEISTANLQATDTSHFEYENLILQIDSERIFAIELDHSTVFTARTADYTRLKKLKSGINEFIFDALINQHQLAVKAFDTPTQQCVIKVSELGGSGFQKNLNILEKQMDGVISVDGQLLYDQKFRLYFYIYYYRDQVIGFDSLLQIKRRFNTIDTTSFAPITLKHVVSGNYTALSSPPPFVNKAAAVWNGRIYIMSSMVAKNDDPEKLETCSTIDVYDGDRGKYVSSFSLPNLNGQNVRSLAIWKNRIIALQGEFMAVYTLPEWIN